MQSATRVLFREYQSGDAAVFRFLNEQWIAKYFGLEEKDVEVLSDPDAHILQPGGHIYFANQDDEAVGCCALIVNGPRSYEVAKMAVREDLRNQGIGKALLLHVIDTARMLGAKILTLETNSSLANAVHVYESLGFRHLDPARVTLSPYRRADVHMEMLL